MAFANNTPAMEDHKDAVFRTTSTISKSKTQTTVVNSHDENAVLARKKGDKSSHGRLVHALSRTARGIRKIHHIVDSNAAEDYDDCNGDEDDDDDRSADSDSDEDSDSDREQDDNNRSRSKAATNRPRVASNTPKAKRVEMLKPKGCVIQIKHPCKADEASPSSPPHTTDAIHEQEKVQTLRSNSNDGIQQKDQVEINEKEIAGDGNPEHTQPNVNEATLSAQRISRGLQVVSWIIMILFPLLFLSLGIAAAALNGHPTGPSARLVQAKDIAISLWPVIFAAVVAQTLKAYAAYKVERGIRLVTLEQLMSSPSLAGAIKQPFILRTFNWTTIFLLLIWGLSPLANQALVRMVHTDAVDVPQSANVQYFQPQSMLPNATEFSYMVGGDLGDITEINAMYTGLLIGSKSSRAADQDFWTNLKIPLYDDDDENDVTAASFSSLLGVPLSIPTPDQKNPPTDQLQRTFTMITTYFRLNCTDMMSVNTSDPDIVHLNLTASASTTLLLSAENNTELIYNTPAFNTHSGGAIPYHLPGPQGIIHFAISDPNYYGRVANGSSYFQYAPMLLYSQCAYDQVLVNNTVSCDGVGATADCAVTEQELLDPSDEELAPLGYSLIEAMLRVGDNPSNNTQLPTETEQYIYNPDFAALSSSANSLPSGGDGFLNMPGTQISQNFGQLVNTIWLAGTKHKLFLGGDLDDLHEAEPTGWVISNTLAVVHGNEVTSYIASWAWCATLIVCSVILLVAAVANAILESRTVGPNFLGFANTTLRKGVKLPRGMNQLSASDRLHALRECEILLQDVRPGDEDMGKIALGVREDDSVRLVPGRKYR